MEYFLERNLADGPLRSLVHRGVCLRVESHDDRSRPFVRCATEKRWYRRPDDDEDDDHDVPHTPTGRLRGLHRGGREGELGGGEVSAVPREGGGGRVEVAGSPVSGPRGGKKKRKAEKRDDGGPPRRGEEVSSRQQALPRRGWVAPRRPRINKTTARPSPVLGPAWPLPAVYLRDVGRPTSRRGSTRRARASPSPRAHQPPEAAAAPRRDRPRAARKPARVRKLASRIDIRRRRAGVPTGKIRDKCTRFAELDDFARKFRDGRNGFLRCSAKGKFI